MKCSECGQEKPKRDLHFEISRKANDIACRFGAEPDVAFLGDLEVELMMDAFNNRTVFGRDDVLTLEEMRRRMRLGNMLLFVQAGPIRIYAVDLPEHLSVTWKAKKKS